MTNPQDQVLDFYRASLKATGDIITASLKAAERLRTQQLAAISAALGSHERAVAEIDAAKGFEELVAVQGKLASAQYQSVVDYWNGICQSAGQGQAEVTRQVQAQAAQIRENFQKALGAGSGGSNPMMAALQPLVDAASSAYAMTARATEEATKLAAAQLATANAGIRQAAEQVTRKSA